MDVPGFQIKKAIGKGGMGTAYLAVQESLGRQVVLKTMNTAQAEQTDFLERFLNEGRIVAALRHPHIITIFDIGATDDVVYMSMEYIEGGDLKDRIDPSNGPDVALNLVSDIASALAFAHQEGIIHRDVKPANILFRSDGIPLLSDFGIAKQTKIDAELTSTGTILGSPFYMSPEQAEGHKVDGRTDIYSLGIIFYEMLTGNRPYPGDSAIKIIVQHIQSPIPTLPEHLKKYQALLNLLIAKRPEDRFSNAGDVVDYIQEMRDRESRIKNPTTTEAAVVTSKSSAMAFVEQNKRVIALLAMVAILLAAFAGFYKYTEKLTESHFARRSIPPEDIELTQASTGDGNNGQDAALDPNSQVNREDVIMALEWLAQTRLKQDMLTDPPADNAHYYYSRLFPLDKNKAGSGFSAIAERYVVLAEKEFSAANFRQAQTYITLGLQVEPSNEGLLALQSFIDNRDRSIIENIKSFFSSSG